MYMLGVRDDLHVVNVKILHTKLLFVPWALKGLILPSLSIISGTWHVVICIYMYMHGVMFLHWKPP